METDRASLADQATDAEMEAELAGLLQEVAVLRATSVTSMMQTGGLFDDMIDELNQPPAEISKEDRGEAEDKVAQVFRQMIEGERSCSELEQELTLWTDSGFFDAIPGMVDAGTSPDSAVMIPSSGDEGEISSAHSAVLAGLGAALAAKLGGQGTAEPQTLWHYAADGKQIGPLPESDLRERVRSGQLSSHGYVWREGLSDWIAVSEAGLLEQPPQAVQQPSSPQPPASMANEEPVWLYLDANHQQVGPITQSQLQALLAANSIRHDCLVWTEGMSEWQSAAAAGLAASMVTTQDNPSCPGCGKQLAPGSKFCGGCGTKVGAAAPSPIAASGRPSCPHCQAVLKPNARFCGKCGRQLSSTVR